MNERGTKDAKFTTSSCCSTDEQETCCEPEAKATCCEKVADEDAPAVRATCGCR